MEVVDAKVPLAVVITEGVAVKDTAEFFTYAQKAGTTRLIGPNCPGLISPGQSNAGIIPADISGPGVVGAGVQVRHADLPDDVRAAGLGFSTAIGIAGDRSSGRPNRLRRGVRGGSRHRRHRDDRRDRWRRRRASRAASRTTMIEAGGRGRTRRGRPRRRQRPWACRRDRERLGGPRRRSKSLSRRRVSRSGRRRRRPPS